VRPVEGLWGRVVALLEAEQRLFQSSEVSEVRGLDALALHDREVDLDLVNGGKHSARRVRRGAGRRIALVVVVVVVVVVIAWVVVR